MLNQQDEFKNELTWARNNNQKVEENEKEKDRRRKYLEGEIESDGRVIAKNTAAIAPPERENAFVLDSTDDAIKHAFEPSTACCSNNGDVALLGLQQKLRSLNRGDNRVHNPTHQRPGHQITVEVAQPVVRPRGFRR